MSTMHLTGNLTDAPEITFTGNGTARARFRLASTERRYDAQRSEWVDGDTLFMTCTAWRNVAEDIAEADLTRGARVMVTGRLKFRQWETDTGERRQGYELTVEEIGRSLRGTARRRTAAAAAATSSTGGGWPSGADDSEPPF
ncbi:single-stranded DNA-binding protein [Microbispora sp. CA-102843]|uniref:single-stranded DNA-binding protein n=1 Tax=Microbispora sp. CA-102843 TaxID=3239952 RepID=UPI003D8B66B6